MNVCLLSRSMPHLGPSSSPTRALYVYKMEERGTGRGYADVSPARGTYVRSLVPRVLGCLQLGELGGWWMMWR